MSRALQRAQAQGRKRDQLRTLKVPHRFFGQGDNFNFVYG